jgi:hypothetical protein
MDMFWEVNGKRFVRAKPSVSGGSGDGTCGSDWPLTSSE